MPQSQPEEFVAFASGCVDVNEQKHKPNRKTHTSTHLFLDCVFVYVFFHVKFKAPIVVFFCACGKCAQSARV